MKIEEGNFYRTRGGEKVGPIKCSLIPDKAWAEQHGYRNWYENGEHCGTPNCSFDLIAEWTDESTGPVRTVTRKEIVPGQYGNLNIGVNTHNDQQIGVTVEVLTPLPVASAELRRMAETLTAIADALEPVSP